MVRKRKREIVLAALAVALIAIAALRIRSATSGAPSTGAPLPGAASTRPKPADAKGEVTQVDLQALDAERPGPVNGTRNPFRFRPAPAPPPASMQGSTSPTGAPPPIIEPVGPPPPPRIPLKFIGQVESAAIGRVAVLTDGRGVYRGKEGDIIEGRYRILKIGVESIDLAYLDGRGRQTIRQTGQ
jgi:hypothetical protein